MKKQHKVTPEIYREIVAKARELPDMYRLGPDGKVMRKQTAELVEVKWNKTQTRYGCAHNKVSTPVKVNHEVEMITVFKNKGRVGLDSYIQAMHELDKEHKEKKQQNGTQNTERTSG